MAEQVGRPRRPLTVPWRCRSSGPCDTGESRSPSDGARDSSDADVCTGVAVLPAAGDDAALRLSAVLTGHSFKVLLLFLCLFLLTVALHNF